MSQPAVAHRAGVSRSTVACIETLAKGDIGISVRVQMSLRTVLPSGEEEEVPSEVGVIPDADGAFAWVGTFPGS